MSTSTPSQAKYIILGGTSTSLSALVNRAIAEGYVVSGPMFSPTGSTELYQAMYLSGTMVDPSTAWAYPNKWTEKGDWLPDTAYNLGDVVSYNQMTWLTIANYVSSDTFDETNLRQITYDLSNARDQPNGVVAINDQHQVVVNGVPILQVVDGHLLFIFPFETTDPKVANAVWNNGGTMYISRGPTT